MDALNHFLLAGSVLLLVSILAGSVASRIGTPLLLVFLGLGMLAGEDGPGGFQFSNYSLTYIVGSLALAIIIFDGGLRTRMESFRTSLKPALSLATLGVVLTAVITGIFAAVILHIPLSYGLLLGAIVGSTDAAAVFSLLHARGLTLNQRVGATLEIESGSNDPMAVFLTVTMLTLLSEGGSPGFSMLLAFVQQMSIGCLGGWLGGHGLRELSVRLRLAGGQQALLCTAGALSLFSLITVLGGSGFLAIYVAGVLLGNSRVAGLQDMLKIHDGYAWLSQIVMFLLLGLLVSPRNLLAVAPQALAVALILMFVARPFAVWVGLLPFRIPRREQLFISWVGLRGAVPIILAIFPLMANLENARTLFHVTFFVVLVSLVAQGWTIAPLARRLRLEVPPDMEPLAQASIDCSNASFEMAIFAVESGSKLDNAPLKEMRFPEETLLAAIYSQGRWERPAAAPVRPGELVCFVAPPGQIEALAGLCGRSASGIAGRAEKEGKKERLREKENVPAPTPFFGDFTLSGESLLGDVAALYGASVHDEDAGLSLCRYITRETQELPVVGDRVRFEHLDLVVKAMQGNIITEVGLVFRKD
ncbi:MAG: potassium/proton antiporter [Zoogloeaceae bacterium]|jgi:cell volume regulation protein A|nr:potassium/proton antiporter [Zoogloeaceae bacterium]